jgi:structural maintenance of chromosome 4
VANYIKERTKNAQFVIISLRNNMFELADRLVGIYKTNDATKSITINPRLFDAAVGGALPAGSKAAPAATQRSVLGDATNTLL